MRMACIGYIGHPFEKESPWAYITFRFLSIRWYSAIVEEGNGSHVQEKTWLMGSRLSKKASFSNG
jgi:hypothetical protein